MSITFLDAITIGIGFAVGVGLIAVAAFALLVVASQQFVDETHKQPIDRR